jgi:NAD(P) transhydrogenase subunit alpha
VHHGVSILAPADLAAGMPLHASEMYARTVSALLTEFLADDGTLRIDLADEILAGAVITHDGAVVHERVRSLLQPA